MSATKLDQVAVAVGAAITAAAITLDGNALKVYDAEPRDLDTLPAVTVNGPTAFRRTEPDEPESQLGSDDWILTYTVTIYCPLDDPARSQRGMRAVLGQVIAALDDDRQLGGAVEIEAKIVNGEQSFTDQAEQRQMVIYTCDLVAWVLHT